MKTKKLLGLKEGTAAFLLLGLTSVLIVFIIAVFGPGDLNLLGQLGQRREQQQSSALTTNTTVDRDGDRFTDEKEGYIGTDRFISCSPNTSTAAWPPDFNNDRAVALTDFYALLGKFGATVGQPKYNKRYDLNADGAISALDSNIEQSYLLKTCKYHALSFGFLPDRSGVRFNWSPAIQSSSGDTWIIKLSVLNLYATNCTNHLDFYNAQELYHLTRLQNGQTSFTWTGDTDTAPGYRGTYRYCAYIVNSLEPTPYTGSNFVYLPSQSSTSPSPSPTPTSTPTPSPIAMGIMTTKLFLAVNVFFVLGFLFMQVRRFIISKS